jgi:hypothetical protein
MHIQAILTPKAGKTADDFGPYVVDEEKAVWSAYQRGAIRAMHFQPEPITVSLSFEVADKLAAQAEVEQLPMVKAGLFDMQLIEMGHWAPLQALFGPQAA